MAGALAEDFVRRPRPLLERLEQQAEESGVSEGTERVYTCPTYLEFLPQGVHKGRCLGDLRCLDVFRQRRMIAIGDYSNDVELLQEADIAVAVDNALPEVKAVADYCTVSHNDSASARLIANILPESEPRRPGLPFRSSLEQNLAKGVQDAPPVVSFPRGVESDGVPHCGAQAGIPQGGGRHFANGF